MTVRGVPRWCRMVLDLLAKVARPSRRERRRSLRRRTSSILLTLFFVGAGAIFFFTCAMAGESKTTAGTVSFAVIGDYGSGYREEAEVAALVKGWQPDLIITVGDNNYPSGEASTIESRIGLYFGLYLTAATPGADSTEVAGRFFPSLGNHDWGNRCQNPQGARPYLAYFSLPGNERYYDFIRGPVHFFALDSDSNEPDGIAVDSVQAKWLREQLASSTSPWKVVYLHHPPFSSGRHGSTAPLQWPFEEWGTSVVLSGHDHLYERLQVGGIPYFVNGLGGKSIYQFGTVREESRVRFNKDFGAMLVEASPAAIRFRFISRGRRLVDDHTVTARPD